MVSCFSERETSARLPASHQSGSFCQKWEVLSLFFGHKQTLSAAQAPGDSKVNSGFSACAGSTHMAILVIVALQLLPSTHY